MDGWTEVTSKKKNNKPKPQGGPQVQYGGKTTGGKLVAGPIARGGGVPKWNADDDFSSNNQASAIADYDYGIDRDEEVKYEIVSHKCATGVQNARLAAALTQGQLAAKVNEKTAAIVELENGTARYNAELINRIEKALNTHIDRGRKSNKKKKKN